MNTQIKRENVDPRLAKRLILYVVLFSSLVTLAITAFQLYHDYARDIQFIEAELEQVRHVHAESLAASLWSVDQESVRLELEGILRMPDMQFAEITEGETVWASAGSVTSSNTIERTIPLTYVSKGRPRQLGELRVLASLDGVYQRLVDRAVSIVVGNAIKTFLVAAFIVFIFYNLVTRHLVGIARFLRSLKIENAGQSELALDRPRARDRRNDELDIVADGINKMCADIGDAYARLKASEEQYRNVVTLAQEGIWVIDQDGVTTFVNPAMARMLGYGVDEMIGRHLFDFMDERGRVIAADKLDQRKRGERGQHDFEFLCKNGERKYTTLAASPIRDGQGNYAGAIAGILDITDRVRAEKELKRYQEHLEELVKERTSALEASNKELEAFSYSIAHDLRAPLRSITGFSQILRDEAAAKLTDQEKNMLDRVANAGKSMAALIDDILKLARISRVQIVRDRVNLSQLASDVIEHLRAADPQRTADVEIADELWVQGDRNLLRVLLQNLLENAWKFSANVDHARIEFGRTQRDGVDWFFVKDNGVGFDPAYQDKLFLLFHRLHRADEFPGTGVGLATVQRIVQRHGGKVWAESQEGRGATFYFSVGNGAAGS